MTDEKSSLTRRALIGAGLVLPVTFITGAQADPLVRMAYEDQSGNGEVPLQPFPAENNPNVNSSDLGPPAGEGALGASSALQQAQHLNSGPETPGQAYDNGSGPDDQNGPLNQPAPEAPPTPEAAPVAVPPAVAADQQYQQLSTQAAQAEQAQTQTQQDQAKADAAWNAVKTNPNVSPDTLTNTLNQKQQADSAAVWARYQAQQAQDAAKNRANQVIYTLQNAPGQK